jgi:ABC-type sugar transport system ATPase subunit
MRVEIANLHQRMGRTTVYVTHDQVEAMTLADTIVVFNNGRIEQVGSPLDLYNHPANRFVAGFIGSPKMNFLNGRIEVSNGAAWAEVVGGKLQLPAANADLGGRDVEIGIRPEHIDIVSPEQAPLVGRVRYTEQLGGETFLYCDVGGSAERLVVKRAGQHRFAADELVGLAATELYCFTAEGQALGRDVLAGR